MEASTLPEASGDSINAAHSSRMQTKGTTVVTQSSCFFISVRDAESDCRFMSSSLFKKYKNI